MSTETKSARTTDVAADTWRVATLETAADQVWIQSDVTGHVVMTTSRFCFSSSHRSESDVLSGVGFDAYPKKMRDGSFTTTQEEAAASNQNQMRQLTMMAAAPHLFRELRRLVQLLEPLEASGALDVPGLATLNGARAALAAAEWKRG